MAVDQIKLPIVDGLPDFKNVVIEKDQPLFAKIGDYDIYFGAGILDNTESAGAMDPDGYVYIYGIRVKRDNSLDKQVVVARVKKEEFPDKSKWLFFDGKDWKPGIDTVNTDSAILANHASNELSVTPIDTGIYKGKYILIYSVGGIVPELEYRIGDTPYGPFDDPVKFYSAPEPNIYKDSVIYNAKAHPHLSKPGELLISYNVNMWLVSPETSEIYRPRFLTLKLNELAEPEKVSNDRQNIAAGKDVTASHNNEDAYKAVDKKTDMWIGSGDGDKWLMVDLGDEYTITRWVVKHSSSAGGITAYNTKDYKLQKSMDGENWEDVDSVVYNTAPKTDRVVDAFNARYVRLYITNPSQSNETAARISEFEVYGRPVEETPDPTPTPVEETPAPTPVEESPAPAPGGEPPDDSESPRTGDNGIVAVAVLLAIAGVSMLFIKRRAAN